MTKPAYQGAYSLRFSNYIAGKAASGTGSGTGTGTAHLLSVTSGDPSMGEASVIKLVPNSPMSSEDSVQQVSRASQEAGDRYRATAKAFDGYRFVRFETNIDGVGNTSANPLEFSLVKDTRVVARFEKEPSAALKVRIARVGWDGNMGRVNGDGLVLDNDGRANKGVLTAAPGATVTMTATPLAGYRFVKWHGAPVDGKTSATVSFPMNADYTITAEFAWTGTEGGGASGGGGSASGGTSSTGVSAIGSSDTVGKVKAFVKKWWWALAIAAWVCYEETKGGSK